MLLVSFDSLLHRTHQTLSPAAKRRLEGLKGAVLQQQLEIEQKRAEEEKLQRSVEDQLRGRVRQLEREVRM